MRERPARRLDVADETSALAVALAEADRVRAILLAPEAAGLEKLALHLAFSTGESVASAHEILQIARTEAGLPAVLPTGATIN